MVQVEAARQVLVRLALPGMNRDHQPRNALQQLPDPVRRAQVQLLLGHRSLAGGRSRPQQIDT